MAEGGPVQHKSAMRLEGGFAAVASQTGIKKVLFLPRQAGMTLCAFNSAYLIVTHQVSSNLWRHIYLVSGDFIFQYFILPDDSTGKCVPLLSRFRFSVR